MKGMNKYLFEPFWKRYPKGFRRDGHGCIQGGKDNAEKAWNGLTVAKQKRAVQAVTLIKKDKFVPHAGKWLRQNYYDPLLENAAAVRTKKSLRKASMKQIDGKEYEPWILEQSHASLVIFLKQYPQYGWLVKKLRPELEF